MLSLPISPAEATPIKDCLSWANADGKTYYFANLDPIDHHPADDRRALQLRLARLHHKSHVRRLDDLLDDNVLPKKGFLSKAERAREQEKEFAEMRRKHPAVESAINNLEQRGLDRVLAHGADGFAQVVGLSVLALNVHRIGLLLRRKARRRTA